MIVLYIRSDLSMVLYCLSPQGRSMSSERSLDKDKLEKEKKKDLDRLKKDLSELTDRPLEIKRSRLDSPALSSSSHTPSPTPPPSRGEADLEMEEEEGSEAGDSYGDLEMNLEDQVRGYICIDSSSFYDTCSSTVAAVCARHSPRRAATS